MVSCLDLFQRCPSLVTHRSLTNNSVHTQVTRKAHPLHGLDDEEDFDNYEDEDGQDRIQRHLPRDLLSRYLNSVSIAFADTSLLQVCFKDSRLISYLQVTKHFKPNLPA